MKVAIYCRVSTEEQTTENQRLRLVEYAERQGWSYEVFEEVMSSRKTRPVKAGLLHRLRAKEFTAVLVTKLDRWARSSIELILEIEELHKQGVNFVSLYDNIDLSSSGGKLQFQILSAFAEFERNLIRERTLEGLHRAKSQNKHLGRPFGAKDKRNRKKAGYLLRGLRGVMEEFEALGHANPLEYYMRTPKKKILDDLKALKEGNPNKPPQIMQTSKKGQKTGKPPLS